jgi:hypothetical protein
MSLTIKSTTPLNTTSFNSLLRESLASPLTIHISDQQDSLLDNKTILDIHLWLHPLIFFQCTHEKHPHNTYHSTSQINYHLKFPFFITIIYISPRNLPSTTSLTIFFHPPFKLHYNNQHANPSTVAMVAKIPRASNHNQEKQGHSPPP